MRVVVRTGRAAGFRAATSAQLTNSALRRVGADRLRRIKGPALVVVVEVGVGVVVVLVGVGVGESGDT